MQRPETHFKPSAPTQKRSMPMPVNSIELLSIDLTNGQPLPEWAVEYSNTFAGALT